MPSTRFSPQIFFHQYSRILFDFLKILEDAQGFFKILQDLGKLLKYFCKIFEDS